MFWRVENSGKRSYLWKDIALKAVTMAKLDFDYTYAEYTLKRPPSSFVFCLSNFSRRLDPLWRKFLDPRLNIKSIGNILSWTICEPIWSVLFLLCSHAYFHIYSLWSVNWPRKSLGYKVMMCRTDKLIHGTNTTYPLCNLLHENSQQAMLYSTLLCTSQISWFVFRLPVSNKHYSKAIHATYWRVPTVDYGQYGKNADANAL